MTNTRPSTPLRGTQTSAHGLIAALLALGLLTSACGGAAAPVASTLAATATRAAASSGQAATAVPVAAAGKTNSKLDCQALANAALDFNISEPLLVMLAGAGGSQENRVDSPLYVDTAKLRTDLDMLATLPDPTNAMEIALMGKPSDTLPQWRELLDRIDALAPVGATPDANPGRSASMSDPQLLGFVAKITKMSSSINEALASACPGVSANVPVAQPPGAAATPVPASYGIGQTAAVGDLRLTLDRVATVAGVPTAGNRFVFAYFTVANKGQTPFQINTLTGTHWEDAAGKQYFADPFSVGLDPNTTNFDGAIAPGATQSGAIGYQLPRDAGDLVWVFTDFRPNSAVFAVKASEVATVGPPVTEPTADAERANAAATLTAFVGLGLSAEATQAAGTDTLAPAEPSETAEPPAPTETPVPAEAADTPPANP
jgi:hypothetical protein